MLNRLKLILALLGFVLAGVGVASGQRVVVVGAMVMLAASLLVRLWIRWRGERPPNIESD